MKIVFHRTFKKQLKKLSATLQHRVFQVLEVFDRDPFAPRLENHPLHGRMEGKRALCVTGDYRVIFLEQDGYLLVIMLDVGTHGQVYK